MEILYGIMVQCCSNLTWQRVREQTQIYQFRQSSNFRWNIPYKNNEISMRWCINSRTISTWLLVRWDFCMGFWYNVVQILPDNWLEYKYSCVSAVRAPISLGMGPAEEFKIAVQLVDVILYGVLVQFRTNFTWQFVVVEVQNFQRRESSNLTGNQTCQNSSKWQYS